jgi:hypothetical protein
MAGPAYYEATINISMNEDWVVPFQYGTLASDGVTLLPFDLTGSIFKFELRVQESDHEAIVSVWSPNNGIYFYNNDPTTGSFYIAITRDKLIRLFPGKFTADLVRQMPSGYQERIIDGTATVVEGTTHD